MQIADLCAEDLTQAPVRGLEITLPSGASRAKVKRTGEPPRVLGGDFVCPHTWCEQEIDTVVGDRLVL